jgi:hypothetical protein
MQLRSIMQHRSASLIASPEQVGASGTAAAQSPSRCMLHLLFCCAAVAVPTGPGSWRYWDDAAHSSRRMLSHNSHNLQDSVDAANEGGHSGPDSWRGRLLRSVAPSTAAASTNSNDVGVQAAPTAPISLQERGSGGRGGFGRGRGGGGGWGGGGSYGPSSSYYGGGSASSRFDFGSMWAGGARKLQGELICNLYLLP